jgi:hypothetical protein
MVETNSTSVGQVIDSQRLLDLPLNGRNVTQLVALSGGAIEVGQNVQNLLSNKTYPGSSAFFTAGGQGGSTFFVLDGAPHMDPLSNVGLPMPFPDALQEFKVETSSLPAIYGTRPGGVVTVATRSGSNAFHGAAFEFYRNYKLNARNFFAENKDGLKRNQFGGTLGGPIVRNKVFFFAGYQGTRETIAPAANIAYVPTPAMMEGDFTEFASAPCQGGTARTLRAPFQNNRVSPSQFDPVALNLLKYIPRSSDPCGKLVYSIPGKDHEHQTIGRIDWQKSARNSIFTRYFFTQYEHPPFYEGNLLTLSTDPAAGISDRVQSLALGDTLSIGQTVYSTRISYARSRVRRYTPETMPTLADLGAKITASIPNWMIINVSGAFATPNGNNSTSLFAANDYQLNEDVSMIRGRHQIAFGASWLQLRETAYANISRNGQATINGQILGIGMADFMLGRVFSWSQDNGQVLQERLDIPSMYVQDNVQLSSRLKVNLGLRWDPYLIPNNVAHKASIFDLDWFNKGIKSKQFVNAPAGVLFYGDEGMPGAAYAYGKRANFSPRIGIVYDPRGLGKESIRAGYGIFSSTPNLFFTGGRHSPWANQASNPQPPGGLKDPWSGYPGGNPFPSPDPPPSTIEFQQFGGGLGEYQLHSQPTYMQQWNLSIQKQLPRDWLFSISYLGNRTVHQAVSYPFNIPVYIPGNCAAGQYGLTTAGPCSNTANGNFRRPLYLANAKEGINYAGVANNQWDANANYNSLLTSIQHRFTGSFTVLANHTWSHCLTETEVGLNGPGSGQNKDNRHADYANCLSDRRHLVNVSMVARPPKFTASWLQKVAGNWQLAPIFTARSGGNVTIATGVDTSLTGVATRPNLVGVQELDHPTIEKWFNTDAYVNPGPGQFGNLGRYTVRGPGAWNLDVNLSRQFPLGERKILSFRAEAFNVMNHTRFGNPAASMNNRNTFGKIQTAGDPRIVQLALKYTF